MAKRTDREIEMIAEVVLLVPEAADGTGDLGIVVGEALARDPLATAEEIAEIVREAIEDARIERQGEKSL